VINFESYKGLFAKVHMYKHIYKYTYSFVGKVDFNGLFYTFLALFMPDFMLWIFILVF
jgi:hypothetical protein